MDGHLCFFLGGPHHNSMMRSADKNPPLSWGTLSRDVGRPPALGDAPNWLTWGLYRHEATIGGGIDGPIAGVADVPVAIYAWYGDGQIAPRQP